MRPIRSASSCADHRLERRPDLERLDARVGQRLVAEQPRQLADDLAELLGLGLLVAQDRRACGGPPGAARRGGSGRARRPPLRRAVARTARASRPIVPTRPRFRRGILGVPVPDHRPAESTPTVTAPAAQRPRRATARAAVRGSAATADPGPPAPQRHRGERPSRRHRRSGRAGGLIRVLGDPDRIVTLRSTVKPFGVLALIEAGGIEAFDLEPAEMAILASSHSGEDLHVRTLQGIFRRVGISQALLACGAEGMPLDPLTAARLARDGEKAGPIRHMCSASTRSPCCCRSSRAGIRTTTGSRPSVAGRLSRGGRAGLRGQAARAPDRDRRLRRRDVRLPAARGRPGLRDARRPVGAVREGPARSLAAA